MPAVWVPGARATHCDQGYTSTPVTDQARPSETLRAQTTLNSSLASLLKHVQRIYQKAFSLIPAFPRTLHSFAEILQANQEMPLDFALFESMVNSLLENHSHLVLY